jgi:hypothetical protein
MIQTLAPAIGLGFCAMVMEDDDLVEAERSAKLILLANEKNQCVSKPLRTEDVDMWKGFGEGLAVYGLYMASELRQRGIYNKYDWFQAARLKLRRHRRRYTKFPPMLESQEFVQFSREWLCWKNPLAYCPKFETWVPFEPMREPERPTWQASQ